MLISQSNVTLCACGPESAERSAVYAVPCLSSLSECLNWITAGGRAVLSMSSAFHTAAAKLQLCCEMHMNSTTVTGRLAGVQSFSGVECWL
jgi:hypothetical protein